MAAGPSGPPPELTGTSQPPGTTLGPLPPGIVYEPPPGAEDSTYPAQPTPYVFAPGITHLADNVSATTHTFGANCPVGGGLVLFVWVLDPHTVSTVKDNFGSFWAPTSVKDVSDFNAGIYIFYCGSLAGTNPSLTITLASGGPCIAFAIPVVGGNRQFFLDGTGGHTKATGETSSFPPVYSQNPGDIFVTAWSGGAAQSSNPAGFTVLNYTVPTGIINSLTNIAIGYSNSPVVANTKGPTWGNSAGNPSGSMTIVVRSAFPGPQNPYPLPTLQGLPQPVPWVLAPPSYPETLVPQPIIVTLMGQVLT